ncbi:PREDICTED: deoxyribonuclease-2-beta isoform X1 [Myotis brandtii]|uniref:deoxyribonuclease-2-beta isoform X1 n=1 Tax=Myotis brandtii TaxID=109478 RepID=UPI0003BBAD47|nr:PREDICTED: deoxyribonuclease-2-beta isoform X1 [Myotis brandtii]
MTASLLRTTLALLFLGLFGVLEATISCRNEEGDAVDWFTFYKLPKRQNEESRRTGLEYLYLDSTTRSWRKSKQLMNSTRSVLGRTLEQLYEAYASKSPSTLHPKGTSALITTFAAGLTKNCQRSPEKDANANGSYGQLWKMRNNNTAYLMYNDGVPKSENYSRKYGHSKGLLLWNRVQGFWLIHSIPQFPPIPEEGYDYPPTGRRNGQTGICVTFKYNQYEAIDSQLLICNPNIYSCSIPATFQQELVHMPQLCARSSSSETPARHLATLKSAQGQNFLHFAKSDSFIDDIFAAWMAQQLKTHLLTETWQRKRQELPSNCSLPYHVYNVKAIKISGQSYFSSYQDHAKWCISQKGTKNRWTCIGDLNRSPYQAFRSGGFICTQNQHIYQAFQGLVLYYENCN